MAVSLIYIFSKNFRGEKVVGYIYQRCNWIFLDRIINRDLKHQAAIL